jgi:hypothetical protein
VLAQEVVHDALTGVRFAAAICEKDEAREEQPSKFGTSSNARPRN